MANTNKPISAQEAAHLAARAAAGYTPPSNMHRNVHPSQVHQQQHQQQQHPNPHMHARNHPHSHSHQHPSTHLPSRSHSKTPSHSLRRTTVVPPVQPLPGSLRNPQPQGQTTTTQHRAAPTSLQSQVHEGALASAAAAAAVAASTISASPSLTKLPSSSPIPLPVSSEAASEPESESAPPAKPEIEYYLWDMKSEDIRDWLQGTQPLYPLKITEKNENYGKEVSISSTLLNNLCSALESASIDKSSTKHGNGTMEPVTKRMKIESNTDVTVDRDVFNILDPSFSRGKDIVHREGAIIARLTTGGLMNALAGKPGGIVDNTSGELLEGTKANLIDTAQNVTVSIIKSKAMGLSHIIAARLEIDMMQSTPKRIVEMLCPELTVTEILGIRRRIYDTVILGKGTNASANAEALENKDDLPVAARTGMHDIDKFKKCKVCGNNEQGKFALDKKNGDLICTDCGTVATESLMHEGTQFRKFEGEEDRNHHGDVANPLYSNAYNMGTSLGVVSVSVGAGIGGQGSGGKKGLETILKNIHNYTEMNISQFGKDEKKTRIGYKDKQKKEAFVQMTHVADALSLHQAVLQRGKELFAGFRDDRELVQQFKGVLAACLCEAFDQLSKGGKQILKVKAGNDKSGGEAADVAAAKRTLNSRASKRSEMHSSSLAGKGGVFLNTEKKQKEDSLKSSESAHQPSSKLEKQPASTWTLDDARSWLLQASKNIAKQWHERQKEENKPGSKIKPGSIPKGTLAEMEGMLVQHTLVLCSVLEHELAGGAKGNGINKRRVKTPRVNGMGSLGIRWQHKHERGSGGAGGIGNNAMQGQQRSKSMKTAGQILILKTSKTLSQTLNDSISGEAIHKELRHLLSRQAARNKQDLREAASANRMNQMKRKPWLQARLTQT